MINKTYFGVELEKGIQSVRSEFREKHSIPADGTCVFLAPGNEKNETEFSMAAAQKGIREFLLKYSYPTSLSSKAPGLDNYTTIISLAKGSEGEKWVKEYLEENEWLGRVVIVSDEDNEHIDAMAASDMGIVYDG